MRPAIQITMKVKKKKKMNDLNTFFQKTCMPLESEQQNENSEIVLFQ